MKTSTPGGGATVGMQARAGSLIVRRFHHALVAVAASLLMVSTMLVGPAAGDTVACGTEVTQDTTLSSDVGPCPAEGIIIGEDNVTLDLGGHTIIGSPHARPDQDMVGGTRDKAGILLRQVSGVTVRNGSVAGFDAGVAIMGGSDNAVRRITAENNLNYRLVTGQDASPDDFDPAEGPHCWFGDGITVFNSSGNTVEHNTLAGNGPFSGVSLVFGSDDNVVANNDVRDHDLLNLTPDGEGTICGGMDEQGTMTTGRDSQGVGVRVEGPGADRNVVEHNRVTASGLAGLMIHGYHTEIASNNGHNVLRKNHITETGKRTQDESRIYGIFVHQSSPLFTHAPHSNTIEGNNSSRNYGDGIYIDSSGTYYGGERPANLHSTVVRDNVVNHNRWNGIHVIGPAGDIEGPDNRFIGNRGHGNQIDGYDGHADCENNQWSRNRFGSVNQPCVAHNGTGWVGGPGNSDEARGESVGPLHRGNGNTSR